MDYPTSNENSLDYLIKFIVQFNNKNINKKTFKFVDGFQETMSNKIYNNIKDKIYKSKNGFKQHQIFLVKDLVLKNLI